MFKYCFQKIILWLGVIVITTVICGTALYFDLWYDCLGYPCEISTIKIYGNTAPLKYM